MDKRQKAWEERRKYFIGRLEKDVIKGRVDSDILNLLKLINSLDNFYTLSSCSGRIQFLEGPSFSKRNNLKSLAKFHFPISKEDLIKIIEKLDGENVWISVQSPIIHIACKDLSDAYKMLKIARGIGFKHSGILAINEERYVLELFSSMRIDFPLKFKGNYLINFENIDSLIEILNGYLVKSKILIKRLEEEIIKYKNSLTYGTNRN